MKKPWKDLEIADRSGIFDPHVHAHVKVKVNPMKEKPVRANERKQATVPTAGRKLAFGPDNVFNLRRVKQILLDFQNSTVGETNYSANCWKKARFWTRQCIQFTQG